MTWAEWSVPSMPSNGSTSARGYGARHQRLRKALAPYVVGMPCARCGQPIKAGEAWDLDHTDDRRGYLGPSHASGNRSAGAKKRNAKSSPRNSREW